MNARSSRPGRAHRSLRARLSRIGVRLLLFNVLAVVMPVAGILYLDVYENELLASQERAMVQQARLVVAALSTPAFVSDMPPIQTAPAFANFDVAAARGLLTRLAPGDARIRIYDVGRTVVADSARLSPRPETTPASSAYDPARGTRDAWLYRLGSWLVAVRQQIVAWVRPRHDRAPASTETALPELDAALRGSFGTATRPTPGQRSLTLSVALPIRGSGGVVGAVTVSQSTYRVLQSLYVVRLRIFRIVIGTLGLAVAISALLALTIVRPIRRLRRAVLSVTHAGRDLPTHFPGIERRDEVGDLARTLDELTRRLQAHVALLESFAGDVAHEFRNPLASVRSAIDVLETADANDRERFLAMMRRDVERLDRLVVGVRDIARIDSAIERETREPVDTCALIARLRTDRYPTAAIDWSCEGDALVVRAHPDRLSQVVENLVDNALGFSPQPGSVAVRVREDEGLVVIAVSDAGPGIPTEHRERIFERFFSYRPEGGSARHQHAGLGLAIARAIVEAYSGTIVVAPGTGAGAVLEVRLPRFYRR